MNVKGAGMARIRKKSAAAGVRFRHGFLDGVIGTCLLSFVTFIHAAAAQSALSAADTACLGCHSIEGLEKNLPNGESLSLNVPGEAFARSVHRVIGCAGCHADVDLGSHPAITTDIKSLREYSIARAEVCRLCHDAAFKEHEGSLHAARVREGNALAPVCTGCHGSHSVSPKTAYETCVRCHAAALGAHGKWLPNAKLHHEVVSCAACHAPAAPRMLDLRLYDNATKGWVTEKEGSPLFEQLASSADADGDGLDAAELRNLLREVNRDAATPMTLRGRVELRTGVKAHRLAGKARAIRACDSCHRYGAEPFENVTVSMTGSDGRPLRYRAQKEILSSALAVESLPEFYAIGGTRSTSLDVLFALALLAGVGVPVGHMTVKWLFRKNRLHRDRSGGGDDAK
jgi:hypothetical protein